MCFDYVDRDNIVYIVTASLVCIHLFIEIWCYLLCYFFSYSVSKLFKLVNVDTLKG